MFEAWISTSFARYYYVSVIYIRGLLFFCSIRKGPNIWWINHCVTIQEELFNFSSRKYLSILKVHLQLNEKVGFFTFYCLEQGCSTVLFVGSNDGFGFPDGPLFSVTPRTCALKIQYNGIKLNNSILLLYFFNIILYIINGDFMRKQRVSYAI